MSAIWCVLHQETRSSAQIETTGLFVCSRKAPELRGVARQAGKPVGAPLEASPAGVYLTEAPKLTAKCAEAMPIASTRSFSLTSMPHRIASNFVAKRSPGAG